MKILNSCLLVLAMFFCRGLVAQQRVYQHLQNYDNRPIHFGFQMGVTQSRYKVTHSNEFTSFSDMSILSPQSGGFSVGFVTDFKVGAHMNLRVLPGTAFYARSVQFVTGSETTVKHFESSIVEIPILLKLKSLRRKNHRWYMCTGIKPSIEVGAKRKQKRSSELRVSPLDFSLEYGLGADVYYPIFKFSPELRFSLGLKNLLIKEDNQFSDKLDRLSTYTVGLFFYFE